MIIHTTSCAMLLLSITAAYCQAGAVPTRPAEAFHGPVVFASAADSADYVQFMSGMQRADLGTPVEDPVSGYRLVWITSERGGLTAVTRGDGSAPALRETSSRVGPLEFALPFRTGDGKHGLTIVSDIPCGLICRTTWYYVQE
ncbi:MAG: hypothetical protein R2817_02695 [Flavobacteriales bacterium]